MKRPSIGTLLVLVCGVTAGVAPAVAHAQKKQPLTRDSLLKSEVDAEIMDAFIEAYAEDDFPFWLTIVGLDSRAFGGEGDHREIDGRQSPLIYFDPTGRTDQFQSRLNRELNRNPDIELLDLDGIDEQVKRRANGLEADGVDDVIIGLLGGDADVVLLIEVRAIPDDLREDGQPLFQGLARLQDRRTNRLIGESPFPWTGDPNPREVGNISIRVLEDLLEQYNRRVMNRNRHVAIELLIEGLGEFQQRTIEELLEDDENVLRRRVRATVDRRGADTLTRFRLRYRGEIDDLVRDLNGITRNELGIEFRTISQRDNEVTLRAQEAGEDWPDWVLYTDDRAPDHESAIRRFRAQYDRAGSPAVGVIIDPELAERNFATAGLMAELSNRFRDSGVQVQRIPDGDPEGDVRNLGFPIVLRGLSNPDDPSAFIFDLYDVRDDRMIDTQVWPDERVLRDGRHRVREGDNVGISRFVVGNFIASMATDFADGASVDVVVHFTEDIGLLDNARVAIEDSVRQVDRVTNFRGGTDCSSFTIHYQGRFETMLTDLRSTLDRFNINLSGRSANNASIELVVLKEGQNLADVEIPTDHNCGKRTLRRPAGPRDSGDRNPQPNEDSGQIPGDDAPHVNPPPDNRPNPERPGPETPGRDDPVDDRERRTAAGPKPSVPPVAGADRRVRDRFRELAVNDPSIVASVRVSGEAMNIDSLEYNGFLVVKRPLRAAGRPVFDGSVDEGLATLGPMEVTRPGKGTLRNLNSRAVERRIARLQENDENVIVIPNFVGTTSALAPSTHLADVQWAFRNEYHADNTIGWLGAQQEIQRIQPSLIGVVDQGIHSRDPRLQPMLWVNDREVPGNRVDDDGNGLIDDVHGFNFVDENDRLNWGAAASNHGSFCASQMAARLTGASNDIISVAPNAKVITACSIDAQGRVQLDDALNGMFYVAHSGAKVANLSFGGPLPDWDTANELARIPVLQALRDEGVILVAAAGNESTNIDNSPRWPATLPLDNIITVGAIDVNGNLASYSNYGATQVDIAAPGSQMLGVAADGRTEMWPGTSMAAPMVAAAVSLVQGKHPDWDYKTVIRAIIETARPYDALKGKVRSGGVLDIEAALAWTPGDSGPSDRDTSERTPRAGDRERPDRGDRRGRRAGVPTKPGAVAAIEQTYRRLASSSPGIQATGFRTASAARTAPVAFDGIYVVRKPTRAAASGRRGLTFDNLSQAVLGEIEVVRGRRGGENELRARNFQNELSSLRRDPEVAIALPNFLVRVTATQPRTALRPVQWALENTFHAENTIGWAAVSDETAQITPSLIAVADQGIHIDDPRLRPRLWTNADEVPGNGVDDDRNGLVDDVHGFNFVSNSASLDWGRDAGNHGTFCASEIAAELTGDSNDVISLAPNGKILTAVCLGSEGGGSYASIMNALRYAASEGAKVVNLSLGAIVTDDFLTDAANDPTFAFLKEKNVILVAAAGNDSADNDTTPVFPANLPLDNVITVAAINADGDLAPFSNYGVRQVDLAAPGQQIVGIAAYGRTEIWDGTSMAAPMVTAAVSLVQGKHPDWDYRTVIRAITETTRPYESLRGRVRTGGVLDLEAALNWTP